MRQSQWKPISVVDLEGSTEAVIKSTQSTAVIAGPGSGKTELLAQRAHYLLSTALCTFPQNILSISFKREAARELEERIRSRLPDDLSSRFSASTFDAFVKLFVERFRTAIPDLYRPNANIELLTNKDDATRNAHMHAFRQHLRLSRLPNQQVPTTLKAFYSRVDSIRPTLALPDTERNAQEDWVNAFWHFSLHGNSSVSRLTFSMLSITALECLRENPLLVSVLQDTYPFVFVDEFQDTGTLQYELLKLLFSSGKTCVTVVGDTRQRIMTFTSQLPENIYGDFARDFESPDYQSLQWNHRSTQAIVNVQNAYALLMWPSMPTMVCSPEKAHRAIQPDDAQYWHFTRPQEELDAIAQFIKTTCASGISPGQIAIVTYSKNGAQCTARDLHPRLATLGAPTCRVEEPYRDCRTEEIVDLIAPFIRYAVSDHQPALWSACLKRLHIVTQNETEYKPDKVALRIGVIRDKLNHCLDNTKESVDRMIDVCIEELGIEQIKNAFPEYRFGNTFETALTKLKDLLASERTMTGSVAAALDSIEGGNHIQVMHIHACKGMQFHTVVLRLIDNDWMCLPRGECDDQAKCMFFVALSRASDQLLVTATNNSNRHNLRHNWLRRLGFQIR